MVNNIDFENGEQVKIIIRESLTNDKGYREAIGSAKAFILDSSDATGKPIKIDCFEVLDGGQLVPNKLIITARQINEPISYLKEESLIPFSPIKNIHMISLSLNDLIHNWNKHLAYLENYYKELGEWYCKKYKMNLSRKR